MFDDPHVTRPQHFIIPVVIAIIGGIFTQFDDWKVVGWMIWVIAGAELGWLIYMARKAVEIERIREEHEHTIAMLTVNVAKLKTKVTIDKTDIEGNDLSLSERECPIDPGRMKIMATALLGGRKFTIREWTPLRDGKLLSDTEWRDLIEYLKEPEPEDKRIKFITQRHPGVVNSVYDWTPAGMKWLKNIAEDYVAY